MDFEGYQHDYAYTLQKYLRLQQQHEQLCNNLEQIRPRTASTGTLSTISSPSTSPVRTSIHALAASSPISASTPSPRRHSRSSGARRASRHSRCFEDQLDTIVDEDTIYQISAEEQRLSDVNESIKRALTELLNCDAVRSDKTTRMWAQARLMETEQELRSGRRRRSSPSRE
ncbi:hypothetical protein CCMA1212_001291 [Trichoderma ghanense]|uniref:Uncharacterized protein n=1 Tax=Trichoderma ghanense TaxID=65468 RepID=A0ABY2HFS8_9HYPO